MDDTLVRLAVIGGALVVAAAVALATRRWQRPVHPAVDLAGLDLPEGVVLFTSTDCGNCAEARRVAAGTGAPVREVTWEIEGGLFTRAGVASVPLTVVVGPGGAVVAQFAGVPPPRRLRRALAGRNPGSPGPRRLR